MVLNQQSTEPGVPSAGSVGVNSAGVEGPNLVSSASGDVVGPSQADCPSPRPNPEAVRLLDGDGPSTSHVACLQERFSSSCLSEEATNSCYNRGGPSQPASMTHNFENGPCGVLKGVTIPFQDPPLM